MIDIHNHSLYGVDDGARTIDDSISMLKYAKEQGIKAVVLTPHYRHGMFPYPKDAIMSHFEELKKEVADFGIDIYLGCEYHVNSEMIEAFRSGRCETLAGGDYVLTEYSHETEYSYIVKNTRELMMCGYIPVIAHVERYGCLFSKPSNCEELQDLGAMIQMNADSVLGLDGRSVERFAKKMLKHQWVDVIASDAHDMKERVNNLGQCMALVEKKYGAEYAYRLFCRNPKKVIEHITIENE